MAKNSTAKPYRMIAAVAGVLGIIALIAGVTAWSFGHTDQILSGPVYQSGKVVGVASGGRTSGKDVLQFSEITKAGALIQSRPLEFKDYIISVKEIRQVKYGASADETSLMQVTAKINHRKAIRN